MKRVLLFVPLLLAGCAVPGLPQLGTVSQPVQQAACVAGDKLETAWKAFDLALDAINALGDAGAIVPGSARGKAVAAGIRTVNAALGRAERFSAVCSSNDMSNALDEAVAGMADISNALKGA
ncbi:MAG TPA: hypothetical protein VE053_06640 [Allosphingosinicella sp.]|nr:hypothetical protein [Allosphingosinicella sp.]